MGRRNRKKQTYSFVTKLFEKKKNIYFMSAALPLLIMLCVCLALGVFPFGNNTLMAIDFASQYIDLFGYFRRAILSFDIDSLFYSFSKSLGGDMIGLWGYYLISPFNWLYVIFPENLMSFAATLTILGRYMAMGLAFSHLLIKRYDGLNKRPFLVPLFSTIYALNGFAVAYQMNPLWYDALIFLPLVIIGVEKVLDGEKGWKYTLLLAASIICQYYMSYMMCLFIILYSIVYTARISKGQTLMEKVKSCIQPIARLAVYSILAVGVSAIVLYPVVQNLLISKGTYVESVPFLWEFTFNPLEILSKLYIGAFDYDQMPSGLPNVYVASIALVGCMLFFFQKKERKAERIAVALVMLVFVLSMVHDFSNKVWHLGQTPAWFYHRFTYLVTFFIILYGYRVMKTLNKLAIYHVLLALGVMMIVGGYVYSLNESFLNLPQIVFSSILWLAIVGAFYVKPSRYIWAILVGLIIIELGLNAYLDQSRIGYAYHSTFLNAHQVIKEVIDSIRPNNTEFYRIGKLFNRSKNDPFMHHYPGLTHFSSNMEASTLDLFDNMGDAGSNAATNYGSGTPLTDALYGVRYMVQVRNLTDEQKEDPNLYEFTRESTRKDLRGYYNELFETDRFRVYENKDVLPIGFGASQALVTLELEKNKPAVNQNFILQAMADDESAYFEQYAFNTIDIDNMEASDQTDLSNTKLTRIDKTQRGTIRYTFTPQTNEAYYISLPATVNKSKSDIKMTLNGKVYEYYRTFDHRQLWNIAYNQEGEDVTFEIYTETLDELSLYNVQLWKLNASTAKAALSQRMQQGMRVEKWTARTVEGSINITDNSSYLMTSIPYSPGWKAYIDNQEVSPIKVWGSLMAIPITKGEHTVQLVYVSPGFIEGAITTGLSLISLFIVSLWRKKKNEIL